MTRGAATVRSLGGAPRALVSGHASLTVCRVAGALLLIGLLGVAAPGPARAYGARIAPGPTTSSPYYVCPQQGGRRARCGVIHDPIRGTSRRGPVAAGAITAGPEQETSPAHTGTGVEGGYSPADLRSAYELPSATAGHGQTVAVVDAYDDPNAEHDLGAYRAEYGLGACTTAEGCFRKVNQTGGTTYPSPEHKWVEEISIDIDMVSAICPNCHILLVEAKSPEEADLAIAENEAAKLGATEISNSFLGPEDPEEASAYDHPGIPITAAGGDNGYGAEAPASYPTVIAVGGTTLRQEPIPRGRGWTETAWSLTGSGCSHEPKPAWQTDTGCAFRTANDVAAVADPTTPVSVYDSYQTSAPWLLLGGTSVSTPIVGAAMALASPYTRSFVGAQGLYLDAAAGPGGFFDIVSGANGSCGNYLCEARVGYDGPTGLGSLHGAPEVPPPTPVTGAASSITATAATLGATVNPHGGVVAECRLEYGLSSSYGSSAPCSPAPGSADEAVAVAAPVAGLAPSTVYHFRVAVTYPGGTGAGADRTFTTSASPPTVSTGAPSGVTLSAASLNAEVDPNGNAVGECQFEYGPSTSYGTSVPCSPSPGAGETPIAVSAALTGLASNSTYHFRVVASNANGTSYGADRTLTLLPALPTVVTGPAAAVSSTSATLTASVDPHGGALTLCEFEFGGSESDVPCAALPGPQEGPAAVSASVQGLHPGLAYRYRVIAANASGTSYGAIEELVSLPSSVFEPGPPRPPGIAPVDPPGYARLAGTALTVSASGYVSVRVLCPAGASACQGTVMLQTLGASGASRATPRGHVVTLASGSFTTARPGVLAVRLHLSPSARRLVAGSRVLRVRAIVLTGPPPRVSHSWQTLATLHAAHTSGAHRG